MRTAHYDFTQKLLPLNTTLSKFPLQRTPPPPFFFQPHRMAEPSRAANTPVPNPIQPKPNPLADNNNLPKEIPPPPEKPEPGDCCGSGCVRCVWDIYYEELEQHSNLYKQNDPNPKPSS
ncbi:unnamed protein product [Sphenostylis stenocarpa]|uniref:Oxidoreductase-like domain-containing protein n=1 Tax=Sphenostylis stenocarpa TaxID=92480 RepID=A0AA86S810_9FABA|nr:unnamed protein product [Sphenostylis stenocarpa]